MPNLNRQLFSVFAAFVVLVPGAAAAQTVAGSFEELRQVLKTGQTVVVTDSNGQKTKGKVADLSTTPPVLALLVPERRTFAKGAVTEIRATDSVRNGALIGGGIGFGLALWDYLIDPSEPGNAAIFTVAIGLGTVIGVGIDALIKGKVLYRSRPGTFSLTISPVAAMKRQGLRVSLRF